MKPLEAKPLPASIVSFEVLSIEPVSASWSTKVRMGYMVKIKRKLNWPTEQPTEFMITPSMKVHYNVEKGSRVCVPETGELFFLSKAEFEATYQGAEHE